MTRLYALLALACLARMAAPPAGRALVRVVAAGDRLTDQAARAIAHGWMRDETPEQITYDVIGCIADDLQEGNIR